MSVKIFKNGKVVLPDGVRECAVVVRDGKITAFSESVENKNAEIIDAHGGYILPGFIDIHVHGGGGADFMDGTPEAMEKVIATHLQHGTTSICPTTMSAPLDEIDKAFTVYRKVKERGVCKANLPGLHLEGPFISPKMCGAQRLDLIISPTEKETLWLKNNADIIARISCAPEVEGVSEMAEALRADGIQFSMGHTNATYEQAEKAFDNGFSSVTHMYSATSGFHKVNQKVHIGVTQAGYGIDGLFVELIGDGCHVPKELLRLVARFKGADKICLVTDAMRAAGTDVTESYLGSISPENRVIIDDGVAKLPDKSSFAGSIGTMDRALRFAVLTAGLPIHEAARMVSLTPATLLGINHEKGSLEIGKDADIVVMDGDLKVESVYVNGSRVV